MHNCHYTPHSPHLQPHQQNAIIIQYDANRSRANVYARLVAFCIYGASIVNKRDGE